jgi:RNA polymerase sigma factor (sigma-70 family)
MDTEGTLYNSLALMVPAIARRVKRKVPASIDLEELEQTGRCALWIACSSFDESRGETFQQYARMRMMGAMLDFVRAQYREAKRESESIRIDDPFFASGGMLQHPLGQRDPVNDPFLARAVSELGGRHAAVMGLRFYSGCTRIETGRRLGISARSVARAELASIRVLRTLLKAS